ncbi:MAG: Trm112 family protein [Gammaproteobacteria bacterium]|nr:Trm112 family protein [Gammaproteobacteria bacterium]MDH5629314.1 Trm112 family protein [Gammaproteobacteria bacterium]
MNKKLHEILVCPLCNSKLHYHNESRVLLCQFDRVTFQYEDDIPVLLPEKAKPITGEAMEKLLEDQ